MAVYVKKHERTNPRTGGVEARIIAVCDADLLGKIFTGNDGVELNLAKYRSFYEGEKVSVAELAKVLQGATNVNLVGEKSINAASTVLPLSLKHARKIGGVPHLQFYRV